MENQIIAYGKMLPEFKRQAAQLIMEKLPGQSKAGQSAVNRFLKKEHSRLCRWYFALMMGFLSISEFSHLFKAIKSAFSLKELKIRGVGAEQLLELSLLLISLFKNLMIRASGALENEMEEPAKTALSKNVKPKEKLL